MHPEPKRAADQLCARLAALLDAPVSVVDRHDIQVASNKQGAVGLPVEEGAGASLRVPLPDLHEDWTLVILRPVEQGLLVQTLAEQLVNVKAEPLPRLPALPTAAELRDTFVHDLLRGAVGSEEDTWRQAEILGLRFDHPRAVVLVDASAFILAPQRIVAPDTAARLRQRAETAINALLTHIPPNEQPIGAYIGAGEIALLLIQPGHHQHEAASARWADLAALKEQAAGLLRQLRYTTQSEIGLALGRYHSELEGIARSYRDARSALNVGRRLLGLNQIYSLDTLGPAAYLSVADEETKINLARQLLDPVLVEPHLIETLRAFLGRNGALVATAQQLAIHRNTLSYRLDKIANLTGLDPRCFEDAVQLHLALLLTVFNP